MHLTNYAVNKHSKDFIRDEETGSKRYIMKYNECTTCRMFKNGLIIHSLWVKYYWNETLTVRIYLRLLFAVFYEINNKLLTYFTVTLASHAVILFN